MQRWVYGILAAALVVGISSCSSSQGPKPGDTVTPVLSGPVIWTAGQAGGLGVRLQAQGKDETSPRALDFIRGVSANPVATITFLEGDQPVSSPVEVELSHRC